MVTKTKLAAIVLGAALMLLGAGAARADNCDARIRNEQRDLQRTINRYGYFSRQAQSERAELRRIQDSCRGNSWFRGNGDRDRDDRWGGRNRDWNRDNQWRRGDGDHDRDDRGHKRDRDRDRNDRDGDHDRH
jgi:hypothetical protein